ncbi:ribonuclease H-like domain-containing protein [Tanacetum coccineum]
MIRHNKKRKKWELVLKKSRTLARFEKWKESSKNLEKLINSSMSTRTKIGLGFKEYFRKDEVFDLSTPSVMYPEPVEELNLFPHVCQAGENACSSSLHQLEIIWPTLPIQSQTKTKDFPPFLLISRLFQSLNVLRRPNSTAGSPNCDFYNCVESVPCKSKAAYVPAGSRNSPASDTAGGSNPAASRNRPVVNSAGRPNPAGCSKRPAPVSAGRQWLLKIMTEQGEADDFVQVKGIRCDNGTEFKNANLIELCRQKGIKRDYSNPWTPQQNRVAERKNRTLIRHAKNHCLADSKLPKPEFWTSAVSRPCYVLNRVSITNLHNKIPYELISGKVPQIDHLKPFGCQVTILNTSDHLGKFEGKANDGYLVGYAPNSKAYKVYNLTNKRVEETLNLIFLEDKPNDQGIGHEWSFIQAIVPKCYGTQCKMKTRLAKLQRQEMKLRTISPIVIWNPVGMIRSSVVCNLLMSPTLPILVISLGSVANTTTISHSRLVCAWINSQSGIPHIFLFDDDVSATLTNLAPVLMSIHSYKKDEYNFLASVHKNLVTSTSPVSTKAELKNPRLVKVCFIG